MVFVADALGAWLVEQLADAGRKKLTELILGSEQERALRRAADAAVWATAREIRPRDPGQVAMVISEVFREPLPVAQLARPVMLLGCLREGITGQLSALDDAELTGTGQSMADFLGVPGTVLADRLTGQLVQEITVRGSAGGPLTPLASQLNHELTRLQGQRIEKMLARLVGAGREALSRQDGYATVAGWPLDEVTDPFILEVHRPVQPEDAPPGLPVLPPYFPREHDQLLGRVARRAAAGRSGIAVLVGESSTGKTRACWEALTLLRDQKPPWRLWHPINPSRPDAALREMTCIGPRTVIWLNEAQFYLGSADNRLSERIAAGLRELLRNPGQAPVLVLATLWPKFWDTLTGQPTSNDDQYAQVRDLLSGHDITVPALFTPAQMSQLTRSADVRMGLAVISAPDGEVTQFLAGAPELLARYRNAAAPAKALIHAAMDARRLGMREGLPQAFLEAAATGYITDSEWDRLEERWQERAFAYTAVPCKGVRGPLTPIRQRSASRGAHEGGDQPGSMSAGLGSLYSLADYLDQYGRTHRADQIPPAAFWLAAIENALAEDQAVLGYAAEARGLFRIAAQLYKNAAARGNDRAVLRLNETPHYLSGDQRPVFWAISHAALNNAHIVIQLLNTLRKAGAQDQVTTLLHRDPAAHVSLDNSHDIAELLRVLKEANAHDQATVLLQRAVAHVSVDDPEAIMKLLSLLQEASAHDQVDALTRRTAARVSIINSHAVGQLLHILGKADAQEPIAVLLHRDPARHVSLESAFTVAWLLDSLREVGAQDQITGLLDRDPAAHVSLRKASAGYSVAELLYSLREVGAHDQMTALAQRAADHISLDDIYVEQLLRVMREVGVHDHAVALARRAVAHISLDEPAAVARLLRELLKTGSRDQITALMQRNPATHVSLVKPRIVAWLIDLLREVGTSDQATMLARRAAAHISLDDPQDVAALLSSLLNMSEQEGIAVLLDRDPATHVTLDEPRHLTWLLGLLREANAEDQANALVHQAASVSLDDPWPVGRLLGFLETVGARSQVKSLAQRVAARIPLDDPQAVAFVLGELQEVGAHDQAIELARRAAEPSAQIPLDSSYAAAKLLRWLREVGLRDQIKSLIDRLPDAGCFEVFRKEEGHQARFRFGREIDGDPATPWGWDDLD